MNQSRYIAMTSLALPVTWSGAEAFFHGANTVVGFLTSLTGLGIGIYGLLWWRRKFNQRNKD